MIYEKFLQMIVYSPGGNGKTTLLGTAIENPENFLPMLLIDFEGGTRDAIGSRCNFVTFKELGQSTNNKIDVVRIKDMDDFDLVYNWLVKNPSEYKTVAFDSLMEFSKASLLEITGNNMRITTSFKSMKMPQIQHYGNANQMVNYLVRIIRDLDCHTIFTTGVVDLPDPFNDNQNRSFPSLVGQKAPREIPHLVSIVGYLAVCKETDEETGFTEGDRILIVGSTPKFEAKFRDEKRIVPKMIQNPTLLTILQYLNGEVPK